MCAFNDGISPMPRPAIRRSSKTAFSFSGTADPSRSPSGPIRIVCGRASIPYSRNVVPAFVQRYPAIDGVRFQKRSYRLFRLVRNRDKHNWPASKLIRKLVQMRNFSDAAATPSGPKLKQNGLASQLR